MRCTNCDHVLDGEFCSRCGQKALPSTDYSLRRYLRESLAVLSNSDSRAWRSFVALVRRPGLLTAEYFRGRHARYLGPLQLFLLCNVFYFFVQPLTGFNTLTTPLRAHLAQLPHSPLARKLVEQEVAGRPGGLEEYQILFDATINGQAKTLVILMVPLLAVALQLVFWRSRRYYVQHLVFATHFFAFFLLAVPVILAVLALVGTPVARAGLALGINRDLLQWVLDQGTMVLVFAPYLYFAVRRAYEASRVSAALRSALIMVSVMVVLQLYRLILFFTTIYSV